MAAVCLFTNSVTGKDYLKVYDCKTSLLGNGAIISQKEDGEVCITEFEAGLGDKVKSGLLYVEQWYNGVCERSVPAIMTEDLSYLYLHVTAKFDYSEVWISTNEFGGDWSMQFEIPYGESVADWWSPMSLTIMDRQADQRISGPIEYIIIMKSWISMRKLHM